MLRVLAAAAGAVLLLLSGAGPAWGEPPLRVDDQVTDTVGALAGEEGRVRDALERLRAGNSTQLFVVFVAGFDGIDGQEWSAETARRSQLGTRDVLLAVAVEDRVYGFSVDQGYPLSDADLDDLVVGEVEPRLATDDWAGAVDAMADGLGAAGGTGSTGGGGGVPVALVVAGVAVVGGGAFLLSRRRRGAAPGEAGGHGRHARPAAAEVPTEQLARQASAALIEVDDAVQSSEQELGFAQAQFGDEAVTGFRQALEEARGELQEAFALRQELDDAGPADEAAQRAVLARIVELCRSADERLDTQADAFDRLRDLERSAPEVVAGLGPRADAAAARVPGAQEQLAALAGRYAATALTPVAGNVGQAQRLLDVARAELAEARAALAADRRGEAVVPTRAAEDAVAQAETLLDGITRLEADLGEAGGLIAAARTETEQDLAEARAVLAGGDPGGLAPLVARAESALAAADGALRSEGGALPDPLAALRRLDEAGEALDRGLAAARDAQAQARRAAAVLDQTLLAVRSGIAAAGDFIATRRGAVGSEARTRLAEAHRHAQQAVGLATADPAAALREAQHADALAQQALQLAQADVQRWSSPYGPAGSGRGGGGLDLGSLVLGGILLGGGGARRRGGSGFGGGFGGLGGGLGGGGFGGGRRRGGGRSLGSFGGSGTRGRRGGGGRF